MAKRRRFTAEFKAKVVLEALSGEPHKRKCGVLRHKLSEDQLSKWKQQFVELVLVDRRVVVVDGVLFNRGALFAVWVVEESELSCFFPPN